MKIFVGIAIAAAIFFVVGVGLGLYIIIEKMVKAEEKMDAFNQRMNIKKGK